MDKKLHQAKSLSREDKQSTSHPSANKGDIRWEGGIQVQRRKRKRYRANSIISLPVSSVSAFSGFTAVTTSSTVKPKRSRASLLQNASLMFGREYCYAVEASLATPILLGIGLPVHLYSLIWVISPILGFILQPVLGAMSDRCKLKWGRRRPFILIVSILLLLGMTLFLNGQQFAEAGVKSGLIALSNKRASMLWTIGFVVTGVVVFDFSADFVEGPIRAYVMDVCDKEDVKRGLYYQAIFTGFGGAFGYGSAGISWVRDFVLGRYFATDNQVIYIFATIIFTFCLVMNLTSIQEKKLTLRKNVSNERHDDNHREHTVIETNIRTKPPKRKRELMNHGEHDSDLVQNRTNGKKENKKLTNDPKPHSINKEAVSTGPGTTALATTSHGTRDHDVSLENIGKSIPDSKNYTTQWVNKTRKWNFFGTDSYKHRMLPHVHDPQSGYGTFPQTDSDSTDSSTDCEPFDIPLNFARKSQKAKKARGDDMWSIASYRRLPERSQRLGQTTARAEAVSRNGPRAFFASILSTPSEIKLLCIAHLFGWMGFLCLVLFFTDFVGQSVFDGDPLSAPGTVKGDAYKRGVEFGSWGMAINAASSSLYCFALKPLIKRVGARAVYVFGYFAFSVGALGMTLLQDKTVIIVLSCLIGVMSGTLYTLPYFLVSKYHESYRHLRGTTLERGVGADCALVTCMIQLAQIIVGLGIGALVTWMNTVTVTVAAASVISFIGSLYIMLFVKC